MVSPRVTRPRAPDPPSALLRSALFILSLVAVGASHAETIEIWPSASDCNEEFENVANGLEPGDELVLHGGVYSQNCRRHIQVQGTVSQPIVIRAADGESPLLTRPADNIDTQNNIEIQSSSYVTIRGLRFQGGSAGIRFMGGHHVTLEDCEIYETGNTGISLNSGNHDSFVIRRNHIHHTGLSTSGTTEGEGMYVGCNNAQCITSNSLFEGNYIHHLRGTSGGGNDGIEIKPGSYGNTVRDNVIHDTNIGRQYPCVFVYGGGPAVNIVEGNALWNCGEAIQVVSDAIIRNNLIFTSSFTGITAAPHSQVAEMKDVRIVNNTIFGHPECIYVRWANTSDMALANNAFYCGGNQAVNAGGIDHAGVTVSSNHVEGTVTGATVDGDRFVSGGTAATAFRDVGAWDFWPASGSPLIGSANGALIPSLDFNETVRNSPFDVGAYETEGLPTNPGWVVTEGFKDSDGGGGGPAEPPTAPQNLRVAP